MSILSFPFALFLLATLVAFYLLPGSLQPWWLLLSSYAFCASQSPTALAALVGLTIANFALSRPAALQHGRAYATLIAAVVINVGVLAAFKAADAILGGATGAGSFMGGAHTPGGWMLPVGLSFYSLQAVSFHVDLRRGQIRQAPDFVELALYLGYFPKLLAGPIERARVFIPQIRAARVLDAERISVATTLVVVGLVRKVVIGDPLIGMIPSDLFAQPQAHSALLMWLTAYAFGLYNDFAGYTSIARGVSVLFGIDLSPNFAAPFLARSVSEFWNRWHISLSLWLRDYIFLPLSRILLRRHLDVDDVPNMIIPPMVTMLVSGLWHGSGWHMLAWGGLHGVLLVIERVQWLMRPKVPIDKRPFVYQASAAVLVGAMVILAFAFFRMPIGQALAFLTAALTPSTPVWPDPRVVALVAISFWIDGVQWRNRDELAFLHWSLPARSVALASAMLALLILSQLQATSPFVYAGF